MAISRVVVLDDRLLIEELLVEIPAARAVKLHTTAYWYYRACRAAVAGAGGHLSGPFEQVGPDRQHQAILSLVELRDEISLPDPQETVPVMAHLALRHPRLNLVNLKAVAAARCLEGMVWLSGQSALSVLPAVLDAEGIEWTTITIA